MPQAIQYVRNRSSDLPDADRYVLHAEYEPHATFQADDSLRMRSLALIALDRGMRLFVKGRRQAAASLFRRALRCDPGNVLAHYLLGLTLQALGKSEEAYHQWRMTLAATPDSDDAAWAQQRAQRLLTQLWGKSDDAEARR